MLLYGCIHVIQMMSSAGLLTGIRFLYIRESHFAVTWDIGPACNNIHDQRLFVVDELCVDVGVGVRTLFTEIGAKCPPFAVIGGSSLPRTSVYITREAYATI